MNVLKNQTIDADVLSFYVSNVISNTLKQHVCQQTNMEYLMQIILAQNSEGNMICFRPGNRGDISQPLMELIQMRHSEGWYKESPSAMDFVRRLMDAYYKDEPFIMVDGEESSEADPDFEGLALDFLESRSHYAKEKIEVLETEN